MQIMQKTNNPNNKILHSFSKDIADTVKTKGGEALKVAREEQGKHETEIRNETQRERINISYIILSVLLIILALIVYIVLSNSNKTPITQTQNTDIILTDSEVNINTTNKSEAVIISEIKKVIDSKNTTAQIIKIKLYKSDTLGNLPLVFTDFLQAVGIKPPQSLTSFLSKNYFFGIFTNKINAPFLIIKNSSYTDTLQGMIKWEDVLLDNLYKIFNIDISGERSEILQARFSDEILNNKNIRVLRDSTGNMILFYVFIDKETIFIGKNTETLDEVGLRFYSPRQK